MYKLIFIIFLFLFKLSPAYAYLGPGIGGGVIAATLGIIVAIFAAIFGLIWFPLKRLFKKKEKKENQLNKVD
tara:strand:+ start:3735 stop:3950 length:216 start_codon:yes stop_codon:yes gene_type:complete